ncbi:uncharacterized protein STEHIDRAFT_116986 [Stereum hirsutum FP-91666 SS1]|uniref:uncharacterized protein n=1 Tax=Stereum hirsutum (strain FP-91666) TaxID=721885 RepID=UPI000440F9B0|nr:uncharacterized protein STEHIDRAFT_116986 [Stereum hirsutum FP-91666 SS1]EIM91871.1 hypothetical protein STEHIDRAFT_116986 [Stereum hirsutum FP-91666 SS1]
MTVTASMEDVLRPHHSRPAPPSYPRVPPTSPPDVDEDEPFDTLLDVLTLRAESGVHLDTLMFTECGIHEHTVSRFREEAVVKEAVVWDAKPTKLRRDSPRSIGEKIILAMGLF